MRRRSGTGSKPLKARHRKPTAPKRPNAPKGGRPRKSPAARGRTEVARLTRELNDALGRETATSDVLQVISSFAGELDPVFQAILANATRICEANFGVLQRHDGGTIRVAAMHNVPEAFAELRQRRPTLHPTPESAIGRAVVTKKLVHIPDYSAHAAYKNRNPDAVNLVELAGARSLVIVPMLKNDELIGTISIFRQEVRPFTDKQIDLVENFAAQAVIAIENARLLNELREALRQQTATADVLRVISSSPGDLKPVFETMVENATRLCEAQFGNLFLRVEGTEDSFHYVAMHGLPSAYLEWGKQDPLVMLSKHPHSPLGQVVRTKSTVHIADLAADPSYVRREPRIVALVETAGARTIVTVPLLKDDDVVGAIAIYRKEVRPFTDNQIALVQNFAAQAVIAIENARLLNELLQSLEQQTATADVLLTISRTPGNLEPVFQAMLENAARVCEARFGMLFRLEDGAMLPVATLGVPEPLMEFFKRGPHRPSEHAPIMRVARTKQPVHVFDFAQERAYLEGSPVAVAGVELGGVRTNLIVPLLKESELIGAFAVFRQEVRPFTEKQIELVKNFAAQAVIAIENARLLNELRERTDEVEKLNQRLEQRVADQVGEIERMGRLRRFLPPQVADLIVASGTEKQLESHRREITALFCDLRGFTGFSESSDPEDVMALLRDYHAAIGEIIVKYSGTLERYAGDGVMVVFNDPVPVENPALQAVLMALEMRDDIGALTDRWRRLGHDIGFGIGIAHGFATLGTIGFEGRFDYAAIGTVSNVASRLCDEAKPGQILISPRVLMKVEDAVKVEPVGEFALKGIRRPLAAYNVLSATTVS
jgi:GAF domain-containing protein